MSGIDPQAIPTPAYVCEEAKLRANCALLKQVAEDAGCAILLALKGFAMWGVFDIVREYLPGVAASSLNEARLGVEEFGGMVHYHSPAIKEEEIGAIIKFADHIIFNSPHQLRLFRETALAAHRKIGVRVNPERAVVATDIYNPCGKNSRLGMTMVELGRCDLTGVSGLHFHALCENGVDELECVLRGVEEKFGRLLPAMEWVNFGGGHHITRPGYDVAKLVRLVRDFRTRHDVEIFLEPGEAVALNAGVLVGSVVDIVRNEMDIAILDVSASAHMPDVLEMPYRPAVTGGAQPGVLAHTYRLAGGTCLAGDVIGDYSFDHPLISGDRIVFGDALHYSMVKNSFFNGVPLPAIGVWNVAEGYRSVRNFGYDDYKGRLS